MVEFRLETLEVKGRENFKEIECLWIYLFYDLGSLIYFKKVCDMFFSCILCFFLVRFVFGSWEGKLEIIIRFGFGVDIKG